MLADLVDGARALWRADLHRLVNLRGMRATAAVAARLDFGPGSIFRILAAALPDHPALVEEHRTISYGELNARSCRLASRLAAAGVVPGTRVAMILRNSAAFLETQAACAKLRAAAVPLSYRLTSAELRYIFGDSAPLVVVFEADLADAVLGAEPRRSAKLLLSVHGDTPGCIPYEEELARGSPEEPPRAGAAKDS